MRCLSFLLFCSSLFAQCGTQVKPSPDYTGLIGSVADNATAGAYRWLRNGQSVATGTTQQSFLLHADGSATSTEGIAADGSSGVSFVPGKWGQAISLSNTGTLTYPTANSVDFRQGTIEMWVAPRYDGSSPESGTGARILFGFTATNGDTFTIQVGGPQNVIHTAGTVGGQYQSAYSDKASIANWKAGEWHHVAATFSESGKFLRFYLDGALSADTNEKRYVAPSAGTVFRLGHAVFAVDEIRISRTALPAGQILADARRSDTMRNGEAWLPLADAAVGDKFVLEADGCASAAFAYSGPPVRDPNPPSTLLPAGSTSFALTVTTAEPSSCRYSVNAQKPFDTMTPFAGGAGTSTHATTVAGLDADTTRVNNVYVRCALAPDFVLPLKYRGLPMPKGTFPRIANLWGLDIHKPENSVYASKIQLFVPGGGSGADHAALRKANPSMLILTTLQPIEYFFFEPAIPDSYYLKDTNGKKISLWPGSYRLNLTKPEVAEFRARITYQAMLDSGFFYDGCFFDSFGATVAYIKEDAYGNAIQIDADGDGKPDDPKWLDAAWKAGLIHLLESWRKLMPHAYATGHFGEQTPEMAPFLNGANIAFLPVDVAENRQPFEVLWKRYHDWWGGGRQPVITNIDMSAHAQMGYGYGVYASFQEALDKIPARILDFARTYYPLMRFGLAASLMNDGYFERHFSDVLYCVPWWYDEFGVDLGLPTGPFENAFARDGGGTELLRNGSFESALPGSWQLYVDRSVGSAATVDIDTDAAEGTAAAHLQVTNVGDKVSYHVNFYQEQIPVTAAATYDIRFWAKAGKARPMSVSLQRRAGSWEGLGFYKDVALTEQWTEYSFTFVATGTRADAGLQFFLGNETGDVWIDNVRLTERPPQVFRRYFDNGAAIVNGTTKRQTVTMPDGYRRMKGDQAPRYQYIVDDIGANVTLTGTWKESIYDTTAWKVNGPFYHNWGKSCHESSDTEAVGVWDLAIPADGMYTIQAWWAAAPPQSGWSNQVTYEVLQDGQVVASTTLDQSTNGDNWNTVAKVALTAAGKPTLRIRNGTTKPMIADAVHVFSEERFNDGSDAATVTLEPMDGIVLEKKR